MRLEVGEDVLNHPLTLGSFLLPSILIVISDICRETCPKILRLFFTQREIGIGSSATATRDMVTRSGRVTRRGGFAAGFAACGSRPVSRHGRHREAASGR